MPGVESTDAWSDSLNWIYDHPEEVMYLAVKKNRNYTASYAKDPGKRQKEIEEWFQ